MIHITEYFSPTCIPCKLLKTRLQTMAAVELKGKIEVEFVDATTDPKAKELGIQSCPHLIITNGEGKELMNQHVGLGVISDIREMVEKRI